MNRIVLLDSFFPINSRNIRIINSLSTIQTNKVDVICWNRDLLDFISDDFYHIYNKFSPRGNKLKKLFGIFGFYLYIKKILSIHEYDVIIASHWDMLICAVLLKKRNQKVVYDNLDIPTSSCFFLRKFLFFIEYLCLSRVSLMLLASRFYQVLYKDKYPFLSIKVLENLPTSAYTNSVHFSELKCPLRIAFIGSIRYFEILCNLCDAVGNDHRFELFFYGNGQDEERLKEYTLKYNNIFFFGYFEYNEISKFYSTCDVVWAAYPNKDFNVKYAISNKFFDSIFSLIPTIFSDKTYLGEYVQSNKIGFVLDPYDINSIKTNLLYIFNNKYILYNISSKLKEFRVNEKLWDDKFTPILHEILTVK